MHQATGIWALLCSVLVKVAIQLSLYQSAMMALFDTIKGIMGRETDYNDRTIDDHIDKLEDLGVI